MAKRGEKAHAERLVRALLDMAIEVEEADLQIKTSLLTALERHDVSLAEDIVRRWMTQPPVDVAARLPAAEVTEVPTEPAGAQGVE